MRSAVRGCTPRPMPCSVRMMGTTRPLWLVTVKAVPKPQKLSSAEERKVR